ncbi:hypothetical protein PsorP6_003316 [Peronosclerospora sorghi]|uniref:Uncharacterized protein n=1 Tax=Peronosclerospora sorghi TaxID=230839 RepID=A0ACC0VKJ4_9STRA|nr:hypothetical protein PsorP6_003316 [Peronosclerospora sorghi]
MDETNLTQSVYPNASSQPRREEKKTQVTTESATRQRDKLVFRCTFPGCGREFPLKGNYKRHVNIHNGDRKFACKFCQKRFLRKADMEVHYRVHTGEKPYRCKYNECGKCFARRSDLLSHERTHTKPFACAGCDRSFARRFDLQKHQRLHENQPDALRRNKAGKHDLSRRQAAVSKRNQSCDCPSDVATLFDGVAASTSSAILLPDIAAKKSQVLTTDAFLTGRRKMSRTAACLDTRTRPFRYEAKCLENHLYSPPTSLSAFSTLDAYLLSQEALDLSRAFSHDCPPQRPSTTIETSCCPAHVVLRPPCREESNVSIASMASKDRNVLNTDSFEFVPRDVSTGNPDEVADTLSTTSSFVNSSSPRSADNSTVEQTFSESVSPFIGPATSGLRLSLDRTLSSSNASMATNCRSSTSIYEPSDSSGNAAGFSLFDLNMKSAINDDEDAPSPPSPRAFDTDKACLSAPSTCLLDYSRHNRSCGHLSIQHGNHRDYVVQNHLVCQDSVRKLGIVQRASTCTGAAEHVTTTEPLICSSPTENHRPGCGHLPVRHNDHIDYVVEDNLICQQATWLAGDDNLELLGDDFWDFYDAIDTFPTA